MAKNSLVSALFSLLFLYSSLLLFSINYQVTQPGLDSSWAFAVNQFSSGLYHFGPDVIFTYGPLAYLCNPQHVGSNLAYASVVHILVWCVLLYLLAGLWQTGRKISAMIFVAGLVATNRLYYFYWDYLLTAMVVLLFLRLLREPRNHENLLLLAVFAGLCFLVKFTGFIAVMVLIAIYTATRLVPTVKVNRLELCLLGTVFFAGPVAYLFYNPSLSGLTQYIRAELQISSGYSAAMSTDASTEMGFRAIVICSALALSAGVLLLRKLVATAGAAMTVALTWIALKHGYVRGDQYHGALFCCFAILILAFLLAQVDYTPKRAVAGIAFAVLFSGIALQGAGERWPVWDRFWWSPHMNLVQAAKLLSWKAEMQELDTASHEALKNAPVNEYSDRLRNSRVLFFPWEISFGAHQPFATAPLYALQAYSAYTQYLDQESAFHLVRSVPPIDDVFFQWQSIDNRNPLADVPATWNALYSNFEPTSVKPGVMLLKRRTAPIQMTFRGNESAAFVPGAWVSIPDQTKPIGLSIDLKPSFQGTVLQSLYKLDAVFLEVRTRSGKTSRFRVPPDVLSSPFPINTLPLSPEALTELWTKNEVSDPIAAIRLAGSGLAHLRCNAYKFSNVLGTGIRISAVGPVIAAPPVPSVTPYARNLQFRAASNDSPGYWRVQWMQFSRSIIDSESCERTHPQQRFLPPRAGR